MATSFFHLKSHYDKVNSDIFNPMLIEPDPEEGEEEGQEAIQARAPPDLDARIPLPREMDPMPRKAPRDGGAETPRIVAPQSPPTEWKVLPSLRGDSLPREAVSPLSPPSDLSDDPEQIKDDRWINALKLWCRHVSSEEPKQVVVMLQTWKTVLPEVSRFCSVPLGASANQITFRHHVPSQAEWRRTAIQLREEDTWYWAGPPRTVVRAAPPYYVSHC